MNPEQFGALVIFRFKILNFTVARPVTYEGNK